MHSTTITLLRPMATCRKCAFAKNIPQPDGTETGRPRCHARVRDAPDGPFRPVQSGDWCGDWRPKTPAIAKDALRILHKRLGVQATAALPLALQADGSTLQILSQAGPAVPDGPTPP